MTCLETVVLRNKPSVGAIEPTCSVVLHMLQALDLGTVLQGQDNWHDHEVSEQQSLKVPGEISFGESVILSWSFHFFGS